MNRLVFSGHETFSCKQFWLYKGYNFVKEGKNFKSPDSVIDLGVGKNMVASIRFWMKAFNLLDADEKLTEFANKIYGSPENNIKGYDPYLEDIGTEWLLHFLLVKSMKASIFNLVFTDFRIERPEFSKIHLKNYLKRKCDEVSLKFYNESTINKDISVFIRTYLNIKDKKTKIDEDYSTIFQDLNLISYIKTKNFDDDVIDLFKIENQFRKDISHHIFLFSILDNDSYGKSININQIFENESRIFVINKECTQNLLHSISNDDNYKAEVSFTETAGTKLFQFKTKINKWEALNNYYKKSFKVRDVFLNEKSEKLFN